MSEEPTYRNALPVGTMLAEYRLEAVLGAGGFGVTYLGWDTNLEKHVAIKEYLPVELAVRALNGQLVPVNTDREYNYKWGLDRFLQEARTLAKFSHPNIVRVNRYFQKNATGYMVMDYEAGESLFQRLRHSPMPDEPTLRNVVLPVLEGLQAVHEAGFLHRDIKPSNVFIRQSGVPLLIDFGSARLATSRISRSLTAIVSPGYAPLEQYTLNARQGPWTDIYALSAVIYRAVTGENPPDAVSRIRADGVPATLMAARTRYSDRFLRAIEWGLALDDRFRPQNVAEWREVFLGRTPATALDHAIAAATNGQPRAAAGASAAKARTSPAASAPRARADDAESKRGVAKWVLGGALIVIVILLIAVALKRYSATETAQPDSARPTSSVRMVESASIKTDGGQLAVAEGAPTPLRALPSDAQREIADVMRRADSDASGDLSFEEVKSRLPRVANRFGEIDSNGDGRLSRAELEAVWVNAPEAADMGAGRPGSSTQASVLDSASQKTFTAADRNGDGYLSIDEARVGFPRVAQSFGAFDTNRDGRVSLAELQRAREVLGKDRRAEAAEK